MGLDESKFEKELSENWEDWEKRSPEEQAFIKQRVKEDISMNIARRSALNTLVPSSFKIGADLPYSGPDEFVPDSSAIDLDSITFKSRKNWISQAKQIPTHPRENMYKGGDLDFLMIAEVDLKEELEKFVEFLKSKQYDFSAPMPDVVQRYLNEKQS